MDGKIDQVFDAHSGHSDCLGLIVCVLNFSNALSRVTLGGGAVRSHRFSRRLDSPLVETVADDLRDRFHAEALLNGLATSLSPLAGFVRGGSDRAE
jgi:hypothetical protein